MNTFPSLHAPTDPSLSTPGTGRVRATGWALVVLGPCISISMALAARTMFAAAAADRLTGRRPQWHGGADFSRLAGELFGAVFLLGIAVAIGGAYQVRTGRRHRVLVAVVLGLAAVTAFLVCRLLAQPAQG